MSTDRLTRLAEAIRQRRADLGLAQGDLAEHGGPSIVTVGQLERAQIPRPQSATLKRLDDSLGWERGSAARVLAGGEPTVSEKNSRPEPEIDQRSVAELTEAGEAPLLSIDPEALRGLSEEEQATVIREAQEHALRVARLLRGAR